MYVCRTTGRRLMATGETIAVRPLELRSGGGGGGGLNQMFLSSFFCLARCCVLSGLSVR